MQQPATDTQETDKGYEIPMPTKERVMRFFEKVAKPKPKPKQG